MGVYVDDMKANYGRMKMCHMIADSKEELLEMVCKIGVNPNWIQYPDQAKEHFDICLSKRKLAVRAGAEEVDSQKLVQIIREKRLKISEKLVDASV